MPHFAKKGGAHCKGAHCFELFLGHGFLSRELFLTMGLLFLNKLNKNNKQLINMFEFLV